MIRQKQPHGGTVLLPETHRDRHELGRFLADFLRSRWGVTEAVAYAGDGLFSAGGDRYYVTADWFVATVPNAMFGD